LRMAAEATQSAVFQFYYTRIKEVISKKNSTGIQDPGALLKQFPGKEYMVYTQICKRVGVEPQKQPTTEEILRGRCPPAESVGKVPKWLTKHGYKSYAERPECSTMSWESLVSIRTEEQLKELGVLAEHRSDLLRLIALEIRENVKETVVPESKPDRGIPASRPNEHETKCDFKVGDSCYTRVLKASDNVGEETWVNARITNVYEESNTFDIFVYNAKAHGVPPDAVNVPRSFLKKSTDQVMVAVPEPRNNDLSKFNVGDRIRVVGLRSHTLYNGLSGTVLDHMVKQRRYQVRLDTGDVFAIRRRNITGEMVEVPSEAIEVAKKKIREAGIVSQEKENTLVELMGKLFRSTPNMEDHRKFGEFAAGYFIAKEKILSDKE